MTEIKNLGFFIARLRACQFDSIDYWPRGCYTFFMVIFGVIIVFSMFFFVVLPKVNKVDQLHLVVEQEKEKVGFMYREKMALEELESLVKDSENSGENARIELVNTLKEVAINNRLMLIDMRTSDEKAFKDSAKESVIFLTLEGGYRQFGNFLLELSRLSIRVKIEDFHLKKSENQENKLKIALNLICF